MLLLDGEKFYGINLGDWSFGVSRSILGRGNGKFHNASPKTSQFTGKRMSLENIESHNLLKVAMNHPHLNNVLSKGADIFSLARVRHVDKDGNDVKNSEIIKFLSQPNPLQSLRDYLYQFYIYNAVYSRTFQYKILPVSYAKVPKAMWLLPPSEMEIKLTGKLFHQAEAKDIIEGYIRRGDNNTFETDRVIFMSEGIGNYFDPQSKIAALQIPLSNLLAGGKALNQLWTEKGPNGMIVPDIGKQGDSPIPLSPEENERIAAEWKERYDLDSTKSHINFPGIPMQWVPMGSPVSDMQIPEGDEMSFGQLLDAYNHDRDMYSSTKGATFENKAAGQRLTIQNAMQPLINRWCEMMAKTMIEKEGEQLIGCYDHLPCMKEDELKRAQVMQAENTVLSQRFRDGVLSSEDYAIDGDFELSENAPPDGTQANLRGLVGGITGALSVNQFVAQGFIDYEVGVQLLVGFYGFTEEDARKRITTLKVDPATPAPAISSGSGGSGS